MCGIFLRCYIDFVTRASFLKLPSKRQSDWPRYHGPNGVSFTGGEIKGRISKRLQYVHIRRNKSNVTPGEIVDE